MATFSEVCVFLPARPRATSTTPKMKCKHRDRVLFPHAIDGKTNSRESQRRIRPMVQLRIQSVVLHLSAMDHLRAMNIGNRAVFRGNSGVCATNREQYRH